MLNQKGISSTITLVATIILVIVGSIVYIGTQNQQSETREKKNKLLELSFFNSSKDPIKKSETDAQEAKRVTKHKECPKPYHWSQRITTSQINSALNSNTGIQFAGHRLEGGNAYIDQDSLSANIDLGSNKEIYLKLIPSEQHINGWKNIAISEIKSTGSNKISSIELAAIKTVINNADKVIWTYIGEEYKEMFDYYQIYDDSINVMMYTSEYINCQQS